MSAPRSPELLVAPAKLTVSLSVLGRRPDGYHDIEAEMVSIDLHDLLWIDPDGDGLEVEADPGSRAALLGDENIVTKALRAVGRRAMVRLEKRIPVQGGLGGGSTDAGAVLRWAGVDDADVAAGLGADVPFCVRGGRAKVAGIGERLTPLRFEPRRFVLLVPPYGVDTAAVYREWDRQAGASRPPAPDRVDPKRLNDLAPAAVAVEPRLARWGALLGERTGSPPVLAGSGSTWWAEAAWDGPAEAVTLGDEVGRLIPVRTVPEGWRGR
ncbi:MAG: 4-(cytidine 5'-diphospho)-2-C-methyl-D-erythritol kinase [Acidimicrobiales bacterium]